MNAEQAKQLKELLERAASNARQLVRAIKDAGPIDFETDSDDRTDLVNDIESDLGAINDIMEAL